MICSMRLIGIATTVWHLFFTSASAVRVGDAIADGDHDADLHVSDLKDLDAGTGSADFTFLKDAGFNHAGRAMLKVGELAQSLAVTSHSASTIMQEHHAPSENKSKKDDSLKEQAGQELQVSARSTDICPVNLQTKHTLVSWMVWPFPQGVFVSVAFWGSVLLLTWACPFWSRELKEQAADRLMATIHAIISTIFGAITLFFTAPMCRVGDCWMHGAVQFTLGFFVVDFISMMVCDIWKNWRPIDGEILLHHALLMAFFVYGSYHDFMVWVFAVLLINEASTPFIHVLWLLIRADLKGTVSFILLGCTFTVVFFLCRIVMIPYIYYQILTVDFCPMYGEHRRWIINLGFAAAYALNWLWFGKLLRGALKVLRNEKPKVVSPVAAPTGNSRRASRCSFATM